jgi:hypothetical protein
MSCTLMNRSVGLTRSPMFVLGASVALVASVAMAQEAASTATAGTASTAASTATSEVAFDDSKPFKAAITPFIWLTSFNGTAGVAGATINVNESFVDVVENSDFVFGLMGVIDLQYDRLLFQINGTWTTASIDDNRNILRNGNLSADIDVDAVWAEAFMGYRFLDTRLGEPGTSDTNMTLDAFVGGRITSLSQDTTFRATADIVLPDGRTIEGGRTLQVDASEEWFDPFIGMRTGFEFGKNWSLGLRGDVGGFGVGSSFAWQGIGYVGYRWYMDGWSMGAFLGYRAIGQDYTNGGFTWDVITHGPILGLQFAF